MPNNQNPPLYARPDAGTDKTRWQRLDAHLRQVANLAAGLDADSETSPLDAPETARVILYALPMNTELMALLKKKLPIQ